MGEHSCNKERASPSETAGAEKTSEWRIWGLKFQLLLSSSPREAPPSLHRVSWPSHLLLGRCQPVAASRRAQESVLQTVGRKNLSRCVRRPLAAAAGGQVRVGLPKAPPAAGWSCRRCHVEAARAAPAPGGKPTCLQTIKDNEEGRPVLVNGGVGTEGGFKRMGTADD